MQSNTLYPTLMYNTENLGQMSNFPRSNSPVHAGEALLAVRLEEKRVEDADEDIVTALEEVLRST